MSAVVQPVTGRTTWALDPVHSSVEFAVRHLMITTVKGRFADVQGTVVLDDVTPSASSADISIQAASMVPPDPAMFATRAGVWKIPAPITIPTVIIVAPQTLRTCRGSPDASAIAAAARSTSMLKSVCRCSASSCRCYR